MLGYIVVMAAMVGQTAVDGLRTGPVLSEQAKKAQARAQAEFRANEHTIMPRLTAYYQLENERLMDRIQTMNVATGRLWSLTTGTVQYEGYGGAGRIGGFLSVPPTGNVISSGPQDPPSLSELQRQNFLIKGRLRDSRALHREANRLSWADYPIRYRLASGGVR
jgi:hypothetical protein